MYPIDQNYVADILARIKKSIKPIPKFSQLPVQNKKIQDRWGIGTGLPTSLLKALWHKLVTQQKRAELNRLERRGLGRVIFTQIAEGYDPLYQYNDILEVALDFLAKSNDKTICLAFLQLFFRQFPSPQTTDSSVFIQMHDWVERLNFVPPNFNCQFVGADGPQKAAALLNNDETIEEGVERISTGLIETGSKFSEYVWRHSIPRYAALSKLHHSNEQQFKNYMALVKSDVLDRDGNFRFIEHLSAFANAFMTPFLDNPAEPPSLYVQETILTFFNGFLGDPHDNRNAHTWKLLDQEVKDLFEHWRLGIQLNDIFNLTRQIIARTATDKAREHWEDRRPFWLSYWRAHQIKACRLYAPEHKLSEYRWTFGHKYVDLVSNIGTLRDRSGTNMMLMIELENNVVVTEFSDNGAMRIGESHENFNTTCAYVSWESVKKYSFEQVNHSSRWKSVARELISGYTGIRAPR